MINIKKICGIAVIGLVLSLAQKAEAQSKSDSAEVLKALGKKFVQETKGRVFLHALVGKGKDSKTLDPKERGRQLAMTKMVSSVGGIESAAISGDDSTSAGRVKLYKYLTGFRGTYRIRGVTISGNTALVDVSKNVFFPDGNGTGYSETVLRYELAATNGKWQVTKVTVIEASDGLLDP